MTKDLPRTLRDVALAALAANSHASGRELDRIAKRRGLEISYTTINHLAKGTYLSKPSAKTLTALAELSGYSAEQVYAAAGKPLPGPSFADMLPPDVDNLSRQQREAIITVIRAFLAEPATVDAAVTPNVDPTAGSGDFVLSAAAFVTDRIGDDWATELQRLASEGHEQIVRGLAGRRWAKEKRARVEGLNQAARTDSVTVRVAADVYAGALSWLDGVFEAVLETDPQMSRSAMLEVAGDYLTDGVAHDQYTEAEYVMLRRVLDDLAAELADDQAESA